MGGLAARVALVAASVLISVVVLELGCRLVRMGPEGLVHWPNIARERMSNAENGADSCTYAYDAQLGWTSPPSCASAGYNIDAEGFRRTSAGPAVTQPPVLVTGSSFAKGDEVADDEAWPAYLQGMIGRRVLNGGVGGYSLDQTVLRAERIVPQAKPMMVIASFTPDDVRRTELKVAWSRDKPYFTTAGGRLELQNVPVPGRPGARVPAPIAAHVLGWSALADLAADRLSIFDGWYYDEVQGAPRGSSAEISCLLMQRLAALGVPVMVVAEYSRGHWLADAAGKARDFARTRPVLACAEKAGLIPLDMAEPLKPLMTKHGIDAMFRSDHHSAEGNRATAVAILHELAGRHLLPQTVNR
ncbi:hypothetical protein BH10PSE6_BH10PSE6_01630 [soil metagenome]